MASNAVSPEQETQDRGPQVSRGQSRVDDFNNSTRGQKIILMLRVADFASDFYFIHNSISLSSAEDNLFSALSMVLISLIACFVYWKTGLISALPESQLTEDLLIPFTTVGMAHTLPALGVCLFLMEIIFINLTAARCGGTLRLGKRWRVFMSLFLLLFGCSIILSRDSSTWVINVLSISTLPSVLRVIFRGETSKSTVWLLALTMNAVYALSDMNSLSLAVSRHVGVEVSFSKPIYFTPSVLLVAHAMLDYEVITGE